MVNEGIDAYVVEDTLRGQQSNQFVYILGFNADSPLQRMCEMDNIISSKPKMVVIGISYRDLTNNTEIYTDRTSLCIQRKTIDDREPVLEDFQSFYNKDQIDSITANPFEQFFTKRKFLYPSLERLWKTIFITEKSSRDDEELKQRKKLYLTNFKNPWVYSINKTELEKKELVRTLSNNFSENVSPIFEDQNLQKKALLYSTRKLQNNDIKVIIINMPISPMLSEVTNDSTRQNFSNFLNTTGLRWYNYEKVYSSEYFTDTGHLNIAGRNNFSATIALTLSEY